MCIMGRTSVHLLALILLATLAGCGGRPPAELSGLWSSGPAACAAGVGVLFEQDGIDAIFEGQRETLFDRPRYERLGAGEAFRVRIEYDLPHAPGTSRRVGARGVMILERGETGALQPLMHNLEDGRTGAARLRLSDDAAMRSLALKPCAATHPWASDLRGRDVEGPRPRVV
jgi:hypothetical protein